MRRFVLMSILILSAAGSWLVAGQWEFLSTATIGADRFVAAHPEWDGRGVLIAVCDSGVELGLPGLQRTSDGKPKILDARELSDEGVFALETAVRDGDANGAAIHGDGGRWLYGIDNLQPALPDAGEVLVGYLKESAFANNKVSDLNNNGHSDDVFGLVTFRPVGAAENEPWVAFLDTDGDGDLADETPLHDFAVARESFHLGGGDPHADANLVTYALNLWPEEREAALYFDGNGHGTHVAGTAAGFGLNGQEGYNGIAPGAQILALKLGNNSLSGGATTPGSMLRAWRYAVEKADELAMPLVIQMSYGVGSEHEGTAEAERLIDELLAEHPGVVATVSAGNEGPGVSSVGLPAAANEVISVGAAFARSTAELVYGIHWDEDRMFPFSSRGGELAKPDLVAPGFEASSVPDWVGGKDVWRGTSMAAPQVAGAVALIYSAALAESQPLRRDLVRAALTRTARQLPGYGPLDQGAGMADVPRAWDAYSELARRDRWQPTRYRVVTESPEMASGTGPTVFYRGDFYPRGELRHEIAVEPVFAEDAPESAMRRFYRAFDLACDADWVNLDKPATYIKQDEPAIVPLAFDARRLSAPGLYQTRVLAFDKAMDRDARRRLGPELAIPVAVAVPHEMSPHGALDLTSPGIEATRLERHFLVVAPFTATLTVEVELSPAERDRGVGVGLYDPEGRERLYTRIAGDESSEVHTVDNRQMEPGVWELVLWGRQDNRGPVRPEVRVRTLPLAAAVPPAVELSHHAGRAPEGPLTLLTVLDRTWRGAGSAAVVGISREWSETVTGHTFSRSLQLSPEETGFSFGLEMSAEDFGLFTDVAVQILDADGVALAASGFTYRRVAAELTAADGAEPGADYTLKVLTAAADPDLDSPEWSLQIRETRTYAAPVTGTVSQRGNGEIALYPDHASRLQLELSSTPPQPPDGYAWAVEVQLEPADDRLPSLSVDLEAR